MDDFNRFASDVARAGRDSSSTAKASKTMNRFHITAADLEHMTEIARVSSYGPDRTVWTELAVYHRAEHDRPYVAVAEGKTDDLDKVDRFQSMAAGTLDRAMNWFEGSELRDRLAEKVQDAVIGGAVAEARESGDRHHEASVERRGGRFDTMMADITARGEAERIPLMSPEDNIEVQAPNGHRYLMIRSVGITAECLGEALAWLYPDIKTDAGRSVALERDFGMPARTVRHALQVEAGAVTGKPGAWVRMFMVSMRFFDRELWVAGGCSATIASVEG